MVPLPLSPAPFATSQDTAILLLCEPCWPAAPRAPLRRYCRRCRYRAGADPSRSGCRRRGKSMSRRSSRSSTGWCERGSSDPEMRCPSRLQLRALTGRPDVPPPLITVIAYPEYCGQRCLQTGRAAKGWSIRPGSDDPHCGAGYSLSCPLTLPDDTARYARVILRK